MKNIFITFLLLTVSVGIAQQTDIKSYDWKFEYSKEWKKLKQEAIPEWVLDAKFGIYTHWGIYSVPAHGGPDYIKSLYKASPQEDKKGTKKYHERKYGKISEFGYLDFVPQFTAPKFNASEWADVMQSGGVKFAGICLSHHDGFCLWDSKYTTWDAMDMGPKRDIYGELAKEIRKRDIKLAATFHMARTYGYPFDKMKRYTEEQKKSWDIFDPKLAHIYRNKERLSKEEFAKEWSNKVREVLNTYSPDFLWFDGISGSVKHNEVPEDTIVSIFKDYYSAGKKRGDEVVICNKLPGSKTWNFPLGFGLRCYENCRDMEEDPQGYWLADRAISYPWCYVNNKKYKHRAPYHIRSLVDMVSRGGIFFLSLTPKGDGSIPDEEKEIMKNMGRWLKINGEAIYATRRWKTAAEGPTKMIKYVKRLDKNRWDFSKLNAQDVRFTRSKDKKTLYATVLGWPQDGKITIKALAKGKKVATGKRFKKIEMLGSNEKIKWERTQKGLTIFFPKNKPCDIAYSFKIKVKGKLK